ncbi:MAG: polynucleotide adenylyltransferase PcnB [Planctomycetales bacterium]|nr:polynucleotide adenylyltransferase PcnB [Planctomycetales bacterium]
MEERAGDGTGETAPGTMPVRRLARFSPDALDPDAIEVVSRLRDAGFETYLVGGCVRDLLVGITPKDFDVATDARPRQVKRVFSRARIIGRRFRLVHVPFGEKVIEVSTFRQNPRAGEGGDAGEAPAAGEDVLLREDNVFGTAEEDAVRRDFPLNALFYDPEMAEVVDYVGGLADLERQVLRTIGDPWHRFREDPVRILRAAKFAARLRFRIEDGTWAAMVGCRGEIRKSAAARLLEELLKILRGGHSTGTMRLLHECGILYELFPELGPVLKDDPGALERFLARFRALDGAREDRERHGNPLLLAPLVYPLAAPLVEANAAEVQTLGEAVHAALAPLGARFRVPRRDLEWLRLLSLSQRRFLGWGRTVLPAGEFVRRDFFPAALAFLRMRAQCGEVPETLVRDWTARAGAEPLGAPVVSVPPPRRRGGGRRRGRG